ncbi:MAG: hypothetical protein IIC02_11710 [Planctomycetes bacterium]|nr:hypothetical protein [Planctomycetota bacterium]
MKSSAKFIGTAIVLGVLILSVGTTRAGGITPVPKSFSVTEAGILSYTDTGGTTTTIYDDSARNGRVATGRGFRGLALDRRTANPSDQIGLKIYIADAGTDGTNGRILRVEIVGPGIPETAEVLLSGLSFPNGIAFDPSTDLVYWSDKTDGKIYRADTTATPPLAKVSVLCSLSSPGNVRVCPSSDRTCGRRDKIYWTEAGSRKVRRARLSTLTSCARSVPEDLVNLGPGHTPVGLSIGRNRVYWTDTEADVIGRADLGAVDSSVETAFVNNVVDSVGISLGFQGDSPQAMLWTLTDAGKIRTRGIDGAGDGDDFSTDPGSITDIRVIRPGRAIPTVSTWGVVVLLLLVIAAGTVVFRRVRVSAS